MTGLFSSRDGLRRVLSCAWVTLLAALLGLGCGDDGRIERTLGEQRISFVPPPGWVHLDHGKQQIFERGNAKIVIQDAGLRRQYEAAQSTLREWIDQKVEQLDGTTQRGFASRDSFERDGRLCYGVETWDRLTHEHRKRFVLVPNGERYLAVYMKFGEWAQVRDSFEKLVDSLRILSAESSETAASG